MPTDNHEASALMVDRATAEIMLSVTPELISRVTKSFIAETDVEILSRLPVPGGGNEYECSALECAPYIAQLNQYFERKVRESAEGYSQARWLWYVRRLPGYIFGGKLSTTLGYDSMLAETATGLYGTGADNMRLIQNEWSYPIEHSVPRRIARLCCAVRSLSQVHVLSRLAGKGVRFKFVRRDPDPRSLATDDQKAAIALYDSRVASRQSPLLRSGTVLSLGDDEARPYQGLFTVQRIEPTPVPIPNLVEGIAGDLQVIANFVPHWTPLTFIAALLSDPRIANLDWVDDAAVAIIELLSLMPVSLMNSKRRLPNLLQRGYYLMEEPELRNLVDTAPPEFFDQIQALVPGRVLQRSGSDLIQVLEQMPGSLWPLKTGAVIRRSNAMLFVDLYGASARLEAALEFPNLVGDVANARSEHFENAVQTIIDGSSWSPDDPLRVRFRKTLRRGGRSITNVDALGFKGTAVLLVSCKSLVYSGNYDTGSHQAVRNATTTVESAVRQWNEICESLRVSPVGDNFDFSEFGEIIGVVCTPHVVYVSLGVATTEVKPGLYAAVSADELSRWLKNSDEIGVAAT
jgi:hypothetical protein